MKGIQVAIQDKANKVASTVYSVQEKMKSFDSEPKHVTVAFEAIPCEVDDEGTFLILTGTKDSPYGIAVKEPPSLILLYNKKGGVFVDTSSLLEKIKENKLSLVPEIDSTYSIMGVRLNIGVISSWLGEDFLTALHQSSLHDS